MEPTHGRLRATLIAGKIPVTDEALTILCAGLSTIGHGYQIEKVISETAKTDTELKKIFPGFMRRAAPSLMFSMPT